MNGPSPKILRRFTAFQAAFPSLRASATWRAGVNAQTLAIGDEADDFSPFLQIRPEGASRRVGTKHEMDPPPPPWTASSPPPLEI